ncbi:hypothetical protein A9Q94_05940 [Rhodobacterales bacterium 56_14_T64]|nr:hypothetical protein A9Q94_05940 [Rhodobacterales bacterium 56_14_T64]
MLGQKPDQTVTILPDLGIALPDGTRLSAKAWMPKGAETTPLPAVLEYLPYRKSDGTAARDHAMHLHFAQNGYVSLRVDRRGCGDSEGLFDDEYSEEELQDGSDIIAWIARQPWCDGNVGIQGISWGGFNGLQIAARAPDALKAVITIGSTVDRYADDIHYKGGIQLGENIGWAATSTSWFSMPPDPAIVGASWRDSWLARLENTPFLAREWTSHSNRDEYWKHGSVCEDYSAIKASVLAMGGLHDGYRNTMAHLVENMQAPVKGIAGPWNHKYPHISTIAPSIDYLNIAVRWWDHWLKGIDNGVDTDPAYSVYIMDSVLPTPSIDHRAGRWIGEDSWPSPQISPRPFDFGDGTLGASLPFETTVSTDMACGRDCGEYFPFGFGPGELPDEQTHDDALSACFDSMPVGEDCEIVGAPEVRLTLSSDMPKAQIIVRLCDIFPDGTSAFISLGLLNLRHRDGFDEACDLVPSEDYDVSVTLDQSAYKLPQGHRLRVSVSTSYWPYCWPEGSPFALTLRAGTLTVPFRQAVGGTGEISFDPPVVIETRPYKELKSATEFKERIEDPDTGKITLKISGDHGCQEDLESGLITQSDVSETWTIERDDPASAQVEIIWNRGLARGHNPGDWNVNTRVTTHMWGKENQFFILQKLEAFEDGESVFEKVMQDSIDR